MRFMSNAQCIWRFLAVSFLIGMVLTLNFLDSMHVVFPSAFRFEESVYDRVTAEPYLLIGLFGGAVLIDFLIGAVRSRTS